jgi:quinolinate synthase
VDIVTHLRDQGQKILWAPDKHLGAYIREQTGADMLLWDGACIVHEEFKGAELEALRREHPKAKVLAHPESPASVVAQADVVGSTSRMVQAVRDMDADEFIVATDRGIFHKMRQLAPGKRLIEAPTAGKSATCRSCAHCPWMAMNSLTALLHALETGAGEIHVDPAVGERARRPIERMLDFTRRQQLQTAGDA